MKTVICSQPRTGSHLLHTSINKHDRLRVAGETFNPKSDESWWRHWKLPPPGETLYGTPEEYFKQVWQIADTCIIHDNQDFPDSKIQHYAHKLISETDASIMAQQAR